jgi:protein-disulfide isomerase
MSRRTVLVVLTLSILVAGFLGATFLYRDLEQQEAGNNAQAQLGILVREHAPVIGPVSAPVTIVEFFDPACEACRAFHPYVKEILAAHPEHVRLVMRYVPFHEAPSIAGVQILEAARRQDRFEAVLDALMQSQPQWANHAMPMPNRAWDAAVAAGLDLEQARAHVRSGKVDSVLAQDMADLRAVGVRNTPTFFVNGKPLTRPDPRELAEMVMNEVERVR